MISPANLELPYWLLNFDEMKELIIGESSRTPEIDASILNYVIVEAKKKLAGAPGHTQFTFMVEKEGTDAVGFWYQPPGSGAPGAS